MRPGLVELLEGGAGRLGLVGYTREFDLVFSSLCLFGQFVCVCGLMLAMLRVGRCQWG
ncbi:hypothetical protein RchiOBHm_Chr7g0233061 [Rosa chinensis]|uniref:Uncharacterized protein n=1 Tax=Rosa chinensis TaxID=74649 RepID=A0A2P6PG47_ROSCH|nr:hypothetical protein RchiOBHm_Chr7g0233061 [Rosa chinensis]